VSVTVDANVLVYASNVEDRTYALAKELVESLARGPDLLYLFWPTIMAFLRIATHPGVFANPKTPEQAMATIVSLLERPTVRTEAEGRDFWETYTATAGRDTRGNHVPDAHLVALMRSHGVKIIYTRDRDFRRYDWIEACNPFS